MKKIILASASPRRRELLENLGIDFDIVIPDTDESCISTETEPELYVQELALLKAAGAAKKLGKTLFSDRIVIAADTIVVSEGKILGKPKDSADAKEMLKGLSGKTHQVMTGFSVFRIKDGFSVCKTVTTDVTFKELSDETITRYIATKEPLDKAGAYGIQGFGAVLCEKLSGDYFNVVGLPVSMLYEVLKEEFDYNILK